MMANEDDRPAPKIVHEIGMPLDRLSVADFDVHIALLEAEVARLRAAKALKRAALDQAGAVFRS